MGQKKIKSGGGAYPTLDLHGYIVEDVADAVDKFLIRHAQTEKIRIITGKGSGKVKSAVLAYLKLGGYSCYPEPLANGQKNEGSFLIPMK